MATALYNLCQIVARQTRCLDQLRPSSLSGERSIVAILRSGCCELLNDGCVIYGATRSTGQIEEDDGRPGFAIVCVHDRVPSWRFRRLGTPWPPVQIFSPCDLRLATRPADPRQVPRPDPVSVSAKLFGGAANLEVLVRVDDRPWKPCATSSGSGRLISASMNRDYTGSRSPAAMRRTASISWSAMPTIPPSGRCQRPLVATAIRSALGPRRVLQAQLGHNKNGRHW